MGVYNVDLIIEFKINIINYQRLFIFSFESYSNVKFQALDLMKIYFRRVKFQPLVCIYMIQKFVLQIVLC